MSSNVPICERVPVYLYVRVRKSVCLFLYAYEGMSARVFMHACVSIYRVSVSVISDVV